MNFRQQLLNLESEVLNAISDIRNNFGTFIFLSAEDIENGECGEYFEVRNDTYFNVFDVHIVSVSDKGIEVVEANNSTQFHTIGVNDLASIQDKINLYEMLLQKASETKKAYNRQVELQGLMQSNGLNLINCNGKNCSNMLIHPTVSIASDEKEEIIICPICGKENFPNDCSDVYY